MTDRRALRPQYHVRAASKQAEDLHDLAAKYAAFNGFCSIKLDVKDLCTRAVADARLLDSQGEFQQTAEIVIDGLLGEGSGRTAALASQGADTALAQLDEVLTGYAQGLSSSPSASGIGARGTERTAGLLHEAGWAEDAPPAMTEVEAQRWLPTFLRHQLMLILFLGPGRGVLELQPYDEDGHPFRMATEPGMLAIVRTDSLWRRFSCTPGAVSYSLSCFLVSPGEISLSERTPVAERLDLWLLRRIEDAAATSQDERWSYALDHLYHKTEQFAIRGMACKLSVHWDTNHLCRAIFAGSDMATEVPSARWDHEQYYSEDPDCWKMVKVGCKHTTMIDGLDLFDARFFRIAPAEVKGASSSWQRQSLTAVYVGCPTSEWTMVDQGPEEAGGCAQRSAGTGIAASIMP
ncbi:Polyketide synthase PksL, partial [Symbiodinium microadriaticum]